jgi:Trk K+ transport system NAD-binding subunit
VLALTDDDEANLAVLMAATVIRPGLPVIARCTSPVVERRMRTFGSPAIINPFDRFGDHFAVLLRAPEVERLSHWLSGTPGNRLPEAREPLRPGTWIVCGDGRFSREIGRDLRDDGIAVTVVQAEGDHDDASVVVGDGTDPEVLQRADIASATGFVAGTDNDILNVSLVTTARRLSPTITVVARQNQPKNADLFEALKVDVLMIPSAVVAEEAIAQIGTPRLQTFLNGAAEQSNEWASALIDRIVATCGHSSPDMWVVHATQDRAPALARVLSRGDVTVTVGDLLRDPLDRETTLSALPLLLVRDDIPTLTPPDDFGLRLGDVVLMAGGPSMESAMEPTLFVDTTATYVLTGTREPASWLWRELSK